MKTILFFIGISLTQLGHSQNHFPIAQFGEFVQTNNPAFSGFNDKTHLNLNYRFENLGNYSFGNSLTANYGTLIKNHHGIGLNANTTYGRFMSSTQISINYNYQFNLGQYSKLSIGIAPKFSNIIFGDLQNNPDDALRSNAINGNLGLAYAFKNFTFGASYLSFVPRKVGNTSYKFSSFFALYSKYTFHISENFKLIPEVQYAMNNKMVPNVLNANLSALLFNKLNIGIGVYGRDQAGMMIGYTFKNKLNLTYSYMDNVTNKNHFSHQLGFKYFIK